MRTVSTPLRVEGHGLLLRVYHLYLFRWGGGVPARLASYWYRSTCPERERLPRLLSVSLLRRVAVGTLWAVAGVCSLRLLSDSVLHIPSFLG